MPPDGSGMIRGGGPGAIPPIPPRAGVLGDVAAPETGYVNKDRTPRSVQAMGQIALAGFGNRNPTGRFCAIQHRLAGSHRAAKRPFQRRQFLTASHHVLQLLGCDLSP